jgi:hypothetical protein
MAGSALFFKKDSAIGRRRLFPGGTGEDRRDSYGKHNTTDKCFREHEARNLRVSLEILL